MSRLYSNSSLEENNVNTNLDKPRKKRRRFHLGDFDNSNHTQYFHDLLQFIKPAKVITMKLWRP